MSTLLALTVSMSSCSDDEEERVTSYDATYQVSFYRQDPGLNMKQGRWIGNEFIEYTPQSEPPYHLLVRWSDEKGKQAIDYILERNPDQIVNIAEISDNNEYRISSKVYFESPYFFVSSSYNSSEKGWGGGYSILILPQIILKMKEGKSIEAITREYAHTLTLQEEQTMKDVFIFDSNVRTSREALQLASDIHQRDDVEWAETNNYSAYSECFVEKDRNGSITAQGTFTRRQTEYFQISTEYFQISTE